MQRIWIRYVQISICMCVLSLGTDLHAVDCRDDCDFPWPSECFKYCSQQGLASSHRSFDNALFYSAKHKGFLNELGPDMGISYYGNSTKVMQTLTSRDRFGARFGFADTAAALKSPYAGKVLKGIINIENTIPYALVGQSQKIESLSELKQKRIITPFEPEIVTALSSVLKGVDFLPIKPGRVEEKLAEKIADELYRKRDALAAVSASLIPKFKKLEIPVVLSLPKVIPNYLYSAIMVIEERKSREEVEKFSAIILRAVRFFYQEKNGTIAIMEKELSRGGLSRADLEVIYDFYRDNEVFRRDGVVTAESFDALNSPIPFKVFVDLSYIEAARRKLGY
ncbi:MAG: ABC transporter substrate-binding protein [Thermodesulfobacteriota bacterium]